MQTTEQLIAEFEPSSASAPSRRSRRDGRAAAAFIAPNLLMFTVFVGIPIVGGLALSFTTWDIRQRPRRSGSDSANYKEMFSDPLVGMAIKNTLKFHRCSGSCRPS